MSLGPVFRYKKVGPSLAWLGSQVGTAASGVTVSPLQLCDVTMYELTSRDDLDAAMAEKNYEFVEENPGTSQVSEVRTDLGIT